MTSIKSRLLIQGLELHVHLGWPESERTEQQAVFIDLDISFPNPPKACVSDELDDSVCYSALVQLIQDKMAAKSFRLVEHLSYDIYCLVKSQLPDKSRALVRLTKYPDIEKLTGGVCFVYGDE